MLLCPKSFSYPYADSMEAENSRVSYLDFIIHSFSEKYDKDLLPTILFVMLMCKHKFS